MLLLDENISYRAIKGLDTYYPGITHVRQENLISEPDIKIWEFAKANGLCIVSFDNDFEILHQRYGFPPKIIHITRGNSSTPAFIEMLISARQEINTFINSKQTGYLEVI